MVFVIIMAVLAVYNSGTGTRPTTIRTPSESARRDEHSPRARAPDMDALTHRTADNITGADLYYNNDSHCPQNAPHTFPHVRRLPRRGHSGLHSLSLRRKPSGSQGPAPKLTNPIRVTHNQTPPAVRATAADAQSTGPVDPDRSPQLPEPESAPSGRTGAALAPTRPPCSMLCRRCQSKERSPEKSREVKLKRDAENKKTYPDSKKNI